MCGTIHHNNVCHWTAGTLRYLIVIDVLVRHYFWEKISGAHRGLGIDLGLQGPITKKRILERSQVIF